MGNGGMGDGELDNAAVAGLECLICWSYGPFASRIGVIAKSDGPVGSTRRDWKWTDKHL